MLKSRAGDQQNMETKMIMFTPEILSEFKLAYQQACDRGQELFIFNGDEFDTGYAKYLIEYLEAAFHANTH